MSGGRRTTKRLGTVAFVLAALIAGGCGEKEEPDFSTVETTPTAPTTATTPTTATPTTPTAPTTP